MILFEEIKVGLQQAIKYERKNKMKKLKPMTWLVKQFDCNAQKIIDYDILRYLESEIKKLKKTNKTKEEFGEALRKRIMWQYWGRCEYELIIVRFDERIILSPWAGCYHPEQVEIDVTDDNSFDWAGFANEHISKGQQDAKIDIYDQVIYKWNEFLDYCWNYRHKYQRKSKND